MIRSGVRIKGTIIAHEAPRLLPAPKQDFETQSPHIVPKSSSLGEVLDTVVRIFGTIFLLIFQLALLDPAVIAVLEDGTFVEVMTWYG